MTIDPGIFLAKLREEQRNAIKSPAPLTVVSAGAGTGKTMTLSNRFAWLLAADPECHADQILTLTFTNAAASEMRERIARTLREWRDMGMTSLNDEMERLDEAYISTIHSFAFRVIRESGINLDVAADSDIVTSHIENEFWNDMAWKLATNVSHPERENPKYGSFVEYYGAKNLAKMARDSCDTYGSMNRTPEYLYRWNSISEEPAIDSLKAVYRTMFREIWELWQNEVFFDIREPLLKKSDAVFTQRLKDFAARWDGYKVSPENGEEEIRSFVTTLLDDVLRNFRCSGELKAALSEHTGEIKQWAADRKDIVKMAASLAANPHYEETEAEIRDMLCLTAASLWSSWEKTKTARNLLSFYDLTRYAATALTRDQSYASRFRHVLIDEFQDTDELQDSILRSLKPQTMFIVGDLKQAIYRFRHANPEIFAGYFGKSEYIPMSCSYRMSAGLMEGINSIFGAIWSEGILKNAANVKYETLEPPSDAPWWKERNSAPCPENPIEILLYEPPETGDESAPEKENAAEQRQKLALGLAERFAELKENGAHVWDKADVSFRGIRWSDMVILVRSRTPYPEIEFALESFGIPFVLYGSKEYLSRSEVRDIIGLIRILDRPSDETALAGWIESPFSMMPRGAAVSLIKLSRQNGTHMREEFEKAFPGHSSRLAELERAARFGLPSKALGRLLEDYRWLGAYPRAFQPRVLSNVRRGVELLREYETSCGRFLPACADYLRRELKAGGKMDEPERIFEDADAVKVMTIHSSKGLEFPVVALMFMESSKSGNNREGALTASRHIGPVASSLTDGEKSVRYEWHKNIEKLEESEEDERLLYVAMTRAQEKLFCCGLPGKSKKDGSDWLSILLSVNGRDGKPLPVFAVNPAPERAGAKEYQPENPPDKTAIRPPRSWTPRIAALSATAYSLISWCPQAYRIRYRQGRELKWEKRGGEKTGGADLGTLTHWVLQKWDFDPANLRQYLPENAGNDEIKKMSAEIPSYLRHIWRSGKNRNACRRWLEDFSSSPESNELRKAMNSGTLSREVVFSVKHDSVTLAGSIDVFWKDGEGAHIRDWKITPEEDAPHELYAAQLEFYAAACHIIYPASPVDAGLIYLRSGGEIAAKRIDNWNQVWERINNAAETAVSSRGSQTERGGCERCPFASCCGR